MHRAFVALCALGLTVSAGHAGRVTPLRAAQAAMPRLRIITTNDFHGALEPRPDARGVMRGAAEMAAELEQAARSCPHPCETLLLDGGDEFQGTATSNLAYGKPVVDMFNALGPTAAAVGNHEFDWGVDTLKSRMRDAHYADAQRWTAKGDIAVMNNGGIRANLRSGTATYGSLFEIQPFGNMLYRITARGADVRAYFERLFGGKGVPRVHVSGVSVTFDSTKAPGSRIMQLTLADGRPLRDDATYTVVMNDFMATGGDGLGLGRSARTVEPLDIVDLDALVDYIQTLPQPVAPPAGTRFTVVYP